VSRDRLRAKESFEVTFISYGHWLLRSVKEISPEREEEKRKVEERERE
jgi:hypothetical protein